MSEFEGFSSEELLHLIDNTQEKDALRPVASYLGVKFLPQSGIALIKKRLVNKITELESEDEESNDPVMEALKKQNEEIRNKPLKTVKSKRTYTNDELLKMDVSKAETEELAREIIRAKALKLRRVKIQNLDPNEADIEGTIITVVNKYTGKVSKFIPFTEKHQQNGYHIPQIIYDELKEKTYAVRKKNVKLDSNSGGIEKPVLAPKFAITDLPDLTQEQLHQLALSQESRGAIDYTAY